MVSPGIDWEICDTTKETLFGLNLIVRRKLFAVTATVTSCCFCLTNTVTRRRIIGYSSGGHDDDKCCCCRCGRIADGSCAIYIFRCIIFSVFFGHTEKLLALDFSSAWTMMMMMMMDCCDDDDDLKRFSIVTKRGS